MKYTQLIKYPLPPIKREFGEYIEEMKKSNPAYYHLALYHAEVLDGVLAVTVFFFTITITAAENPKRLYAIFMTANATRRRESRITKGLRAPFRTIWNTAPLAGSETRTTL